jgi:hypothetical protein
MIFDVPRITTSLRDSITPVNSSVIYNTDNNRYEYYNGTSWKPFGEGGVISFNTRTGEVTLLDSDIASLGDFTISGTVTVNNDIILGSETLKIMTSDVDPNVSGVSANIGSVILKNDGSMWQKDGSSNTDWSQVQTGEYSNEPTGFPIDSVGEVDRTSSTISFVDGVSRTFSIAPTGSSYIILIKGCQYRKTTTESIQISNTEGQHYIYFDENGELQETTSFSLEFILKYVAVAIIYWNASTSKAILFGDERHGCTMDAHTHARIHADSGTVYVSGSALSGFTIDGNGTSNTHTQFAIASGQVRDEDILHNLSSKSSTDSIPVLYRLGSDWYSVTNTNQKFHYVSGGRAYWNQNTGGTYSLTEITNNDFVLYHIVSTNDKNNPYFSIMGLNRYTTKNNAREGALTEISQYTGLPFVEFVFIATIIFQSSNTFTNTGKSIIVSTDTGGTYIDWRFRKTLNPSTVNVNIHNNLGGIYGGSPFYHSDQPISTTDDVTFKSLTATDNISLSNQIIYTNTGNLTSSTINTNYSIIKFNPNATTTIHGIGSPSNGKIIILQNISSSIDITINHQSSTEGTASNRIINVLGSSVVLKKGASAMLIYSSSESRWRFISGGSHNDLSGINGGSSVSNVYYHSDQPINQNSSVIFDDVTANNSLNIYGLYQYVDLSTNITSTILQPNSSTFSIIATSTTTIHGIGWSGVASQGRLLLLRNDSTSTNIILANQSTTETSATRRIITGTGSNYVLEPSCIVLLFYDGISARWKIVGQNKHNLFSSIQGGSSGNYYHSDQPINTTDSVQFTGLNINGAYSFPASDGSNSQVLATNGSGTLSFTTITQDHNLLTNIQGGGGGNYYHSNQPINSTDSPSFAGLTISGNLNVSGTTTYLETINLQVKDKNIELSKINSPSDIIADGGGITLLGDTNKTFNWINSTDSWTSSENIDLVIGKDYKINGTTVLSSTQVLGKNIPIGDFVGTTDFQNISNKTLEGFILSGDINSSGTAIDVDLIDNNPSSISFDAPGKTGILEIDTTNGFEVVKMSGDLAVSGTTSLNDLNASGTVTINGLTFPISDGVQGQALATDGSGNLFFTSTGGGGGGSLTYQVISTPLATLKLGMPVYWNGTNYAPANASTTTKIPTAIIKEINANDYTVQFGGTLTLTNSQWNEISSGTTGLSNSPGTNVYFLSDESDGFVTNISPIFSIPVLNCIKNDGTNSTVEIKFGTLSSTLLNESYSTEREVFTSNGSSLNYTLTLTPYSRNTTHVTINGITQQGNAFTISDKDIVFSEAPPLNVEIEVNYLVQKKFSYANINKYSETPTSSQSAFNLPITPVSENEVMVWVGGSYQDSSNFTLNGNILTFDTPVNSGTKVQFVIFSSMQFTDFPYIKRKTAIINNTGTRTLISMFGNQSTGSYYFQLTNNPLVSATIRLQEANPIVVRVETFSTDVSVNKDTVNKINFYINNDGNLEIQNRLGSEANIMIERHQ